MAKVQKRTWLSRGATGHKVKKIAWGYTLQVGGKQERKFSADWTEEAARTEEVVNEVSAQIRQRETWNLRHHHRRPAHCARAEMPCVRAQRHLPVEQGMMLSFTDFPTHPSR